MKTNEKENLPRIPVLSIMLTMLYSVGLYRFFTKTVAAVARRVLPILEKLSRPEHETTARGSDARILVSGLWIVNHMRRKLEGICSVSSSVCDNKLCAFRQKIEMYL